MNRNGLIILLLLAFPPTVLHAEFDRDTYIKTDFAGIKKEHTALLSRKDQQTNYTVSTTTYKYRIPVVFSRELRKISTKNKTVLTAWGETLRVKQEFLDLYQNEFKVRFGNETYWIPIQEILLTDMGNQLHTEDEFELYILLIGSIDDSFVFLATEFRSMRTPE